MSFPDLPGEILDGTHYVFHHPTSFNDKKEIIVCVHGIGSSHAHYAPFSKFLVQEGYHVLAYDLIGRGYSAPSSSNVYDSTEHVEQLYNLLKNLQLIKLDSTATPTRFNLVGHSMGGAVATLFASKYPQYIKSLVLLSPAGLMKSFKLNLLHSLCCCRNMIHRRFVAAVAGNISNLRRRNLARMKVKAMKANGIFPKVAAVPTAADAAVDADAAALELDELVMNEEEDLDILEEKLASTTHSSGQRWNDEIERTLALAQRLNPPETIAEAYWQCLLHFPLLDITSAIAQLALRKDCPMSGLQTVPVFLLWGQQDSTISVSNHVRWQRCLTQQGSYCTFKCALIAQAQHALVIECPAQQEIIEAIYLFYEDILPTINARDSSDSSGGGMVVKHVV